MKEHTEKEHILLGAAADCLAACLIVLAVVHDPVVSEGDVSELPEEPGVVVSMNPSAEIPEEFTLAEASASEKLVKDGWIVTPQDAAASAAKNSAHASKSTDAAAEQSTAGIDIASEGLGSRGRLYIPHVGIDVAVNWSSDADVQYYTDLADSAVCAHYEGSCKCYLADHNNQDFATLGYSEIGDTAYLYTENGVEEYVCTACFNGHNTGVALTDDAGSDLYDQMPENGFTAFTCRDNWKNVCITYWYRTN